MPDARKRRIEMQKPKLWNNETLSQVPSIHYEDIMGGDGGLVRWLEALQTEGICLITHGTHKEDAVVSSSLGETKQPADHEIEKTGGKSCPCS